MHRMNAYNGYIQGMHTMTAYNAYTTSVWAHTMKLFVSKTTFGHSPKRSKHYLYKAFNDLGTELNVPEILN